MKSAGLVQIFRPVDKERAEKMRQDIVAEFISASPYFLIHYNTGFSTGKEDSNISAKFSEKTDFKLLRQIVLTAFVKSCGSIFFMLS